MVALEIWLETRPKRNIINDMINKTTDDPGTTGRWAAMMPIIIASIPRRRNEIVTGIKIFKGS